MKDDPRLRCTEKFVNDGPGTQQLGVAVPHAIGATQDRNRQLLMAGCGVFCAVYLLPYLLLGSDFHALVHDNLDSLYVAYNVLIRSGTIFEPNGTAVPQVFNGLPRESLPSELDALVWLFWAFGPWGAYVVNRVLMTVVGMVGMYLLLRRHALSPDASPHIAPGVALCYALLPFLPLGALSVAGIPLVAYTLLNLRENDTRWFNWAILALLPLYSSLFLSGAFLLMAFGALWAWDAYHRRLRPAFTWGLVVLAFAYVLTSYRVFASTFGTSGFVSHRVEFSLGMPSELALRQMGYLLVIGQYHAASLHSFVILPTVAAALVLGWGRSMLPRRRYITLLAFIAITGLLYGLLSWDAIEPAYGILFEYVPLQFQRFHFLHPLVWYVLFAIGLYVLERRFRAGAKATLVLIICQLGLAFSHHEHWRNRSAPTVGEFFAREQFRDITRFIQRPPSDYRVASLGIHPSIAQFNGFHTLDGYYPNYPLHYKHQFRRVVAPELEQDPALRAYYDNWGSRVYLFSSILHERGYLSQRAGNDVQLRNWDIDLDAFRALGGEYILSAVRIRGDPGSDLRLLGIFRDDGSAWDIYLYGLSDASAK